MIKYFYYFKIKKISKYILTILIWQLPIYGFIILLKVILVFKYKIKNILIHKNEK